MFKKFFEKRIQKDITKLEAARKKCIPIPEAMKDWKGPFHEDMKDWKGPFHFNVSCLNPMSCIRLQDGRFHVMDSRSVFFIHASHQ